jgi:hypothetical protein
MDEQQAAIIILYFQFITLSLVSIVACLYAVPLCFIRKFHKPIHLLTLNICITQFICCIYWLIFYIMNQYFPLIFRTPQSCLSIFYLQHLVDCEVFYALCMTSFNRLLSIVYPNKRLFRTKRWVAICIGVQWILGALTPSPILFLNADVI